MNKERIAIILAIAILLVVIAIQLVLNLLLYPFILFSLGNLIWEIPFLNYQLAWIGTRVAIALLHIGVNITSKHKQ